MSILSRTNQQKIRQRPGDALIQFTKHRTQEHIQPTLHFYTIQLIIAFLRVRCRHIQSLTSWILFHSNMHFSSLSLQTYPFSQWQQLRILKICSNAWKPIHFTSQTTWKRSFFKIPPPNARQRTSKNAARRITMAAWASFPSWNAREKTSRTLLDNVVLVKKEAAEASLISQCQRSAWLLPSGQPLGQKIQLSKILYVGHCQLSKRWLTCQIRQRIIGVNILFRLLRYSLARIMESSDSTLRVSL